MRDVRPRDDYSVDHSNRGSRRNARGNDDDFEFEDSHEPANPRNDADGRDSLNFDSVDPRQPPAHYDDLGQDDSRFNQSAITKSRVKEEPFLSPTNSILSGSKAGRRNFNDSAMNANVLDDQELSQILNPNIRRMVANPSMLTGHRSTLKSKQFLQKNFMAVESLLNKMKRRSKQLAFEDVKFSAGDKTVAMSDIKRRMEAKKRKREGIKRLGALSKIYQKQHLARAIERWVEALERLRAEESDKLRLAQVFVVMMGYKSKEMMRIALARLRDLKNVLEKEKEIKRREEAQRVLERAAQEKKFTALHEVLRRLAYLREKHALGKLLQEADNPYGGSRRNNLYAKNAAAMLLGHLIEREADRKKKEGLDSLAEYNRSLNKNPKKQAIVDGLKNIRKVFTWTEKRYFGRKLLSHLKIKHNKPIRKAFSSMFDSLARYERRVKLGVIRKIFGQNIGLLKYQKLCTFFAGLFGRIVKNNRRSHLEQAFERIKKLNQRANLRKANARALVSKLVRLAAFLKADVFRKIATVPAVQELFNFERDKYERSVKLRGALKLGHSFGEYYRRFLFEKVSKTFSFLRRFNHRFKVPVYHQGLERFRQLFEEKKRDAMSQGYQRLKGRATFYLLQRFFRDNIDVAEGLNEDVVFALEHNVPSKSEKVNHIVEFWNTTWDVEEAPVLEKDVPDDLPSLEVEDGKTSVLGGLSLGRHHSPHIGSLSATKQNPAQTLEFPRHKPSTATISKSTLAFSPSKQPYPHNRHSEVCSIHSNHHTKNILSPITKPRVKDTLGKPDLDSPSRGPDFSKLRPRTPPRGPPLDHSRPERPFFPESRVDDAALQDFENFLQQSAQNSVDNSQVFSHFDSFSHKKPPSTDMYEEAYRESLALANMLSEKKKKEQDRAANIFHH